MGTDIYSYVERQEADGSWHTHPWVKGHRSWESDGPFGLRSYGVFGFLADERNHSCVPPLAAPRGLPVDVSRELTQEATDSEGYSASWLSVDELAKFDYDATFEDRRVTRQRASGVWDGAVTADPGEGRVTTYREFLGASFFRDLDHLRELNDERPTRIVFWFR